MQNYLMSIMLLQTVSIFLHTATEIKGNKWKDKTKERKYSTRDGGHNTKRPFLV